MVENFPAILLKGARMNKVTHSILATSLAMAFWSSSALAQVVASDNFNRPDETPFAVDGNWGRTVAGPFDGSSNLTNNQVAGSTNEGIYYWQGAGTFDNTRQFARAKIVQGTGEPGLVLLGGSDHAINVTWGPPDVGGTVYIYWYGPGDAGSQLINAPSVVQPGDVVEAVLDAGVICAKVNGLVVASTDNTTPLTSGTPGFITYQPGCTIDDWQAGTPDPTYTISGTILEGGVGLNGVTVVASGGFNGSATTDGTGAYLIKAVPSGATGIDLTPDLPGHVMSPTSLTVTGPVLAMFIKAYGGILSSPS